MAAGDGAGIMPLAQPKLSDIAALIQTGQDNWEERWKELREDFDQKHQENRERRHTQQNQITNLEGRAALHEGRTAVLETKITSIIGDNTGGSGLLHEIDKKVDGLSSEVAGAKKVLIVLGALITIVTGILALIFHH